MKNAFELSSLHFSPPCAESPPNTEEVGRLAAALPKREPDPGVVLPKMDEVGVVADVLGAPLPPPKIEPELGVAPPKTEAVPADAVGVLRLKAEPEVVFRPPEMDDVAGVPEPKRKTGF